MGHKELGIPSVGSAIYDMEEGGEGVHGVCVPFRATDMVLQKRTLHHAQDYQYVAGNTESRAVIQGCRTLELSLAHTKSKAHVASMHGGRRKAWSLSP